MSDPVVSGQWNIGHICTALQCSRGRAESVAYRWLSPTLERSDVTFAELDRESNRAANVLASLGLEAGQAFFTFLPKLPEQFTFFLGALKLRLITGTLFSNFGEEALLDRLGDARARCIVTRRSLLRKVTKARAQLPSLRHVLVIDADDHVDDTTLSVPRLLREASDRFDVPVTGPDTPSVLHYTSGSTGKPKGVLHAHQSVRTQVATAREVLALRPDDVYWCTADQGWVTGTSYGIIGPWSQGVTQVHFGGGFDPEAWFTILARERISVWYTAPTALRMLMREPPERYARFDLSALRHICSVGEPLNPEVIRWGRAVLGKEIYDTWFQTETGAIMIANRPGLEIRPGSMGKPVAGIEAAILDDAGNELPATEQGHLCLRAGWDSMFRTYLNNEGVYRSKFRGSWYYSGDTAWRDRDGYFWFKGRSDDIINTAGHLVSPFEVESALLELPEVAESGVVGAPDDLLFEKVVAFVRLRPGFTYDRNLELKIRLHVANRVSSIANPQDIVIADAIPKNKSGKIMRRVLKARYLGEDAGDLSTLEEQS